MAQTQAVAHVAQAGGAGFAAAGVADAGAVVAHGQDQFIFDLPRGEAYRGAFGRGFGAVDNRVFEQWLHQQRRQRDVAQLLRQIDFVAQAALHAGRLDGEVGGGEVDFLAEGAFAGAGSRQRGPEQGGEILQRADREFRVAADELGDVGKRVEQKVRLDLGLEQLEFGFREEFLLLRLAQFGFRELPAGAVQPLAGGENQRTGDAKEQRQTKRGETLGEEEQRMVAHERAADEESGGQAEGDDWNRRQPGAEPGRQPAVRQRERQMHRPANAERDGQNRRKVAEVGQPPHQHRDRGGEQPHLRESDDKPNHVCRSWSSSFWIRHRLAGRGSAGVRGMEAEPEAHRDVFTASAEPRPARRWPAQYLGRSLQTAA